jgi:hypothetical protein
MNTFQFMLVLLGMGTFMTLLSFGAIYGIASLLGIGDEVVDVRITFTFFVISCLVMYGASFGVFAGVQKDSCGEVKNWKQIALNALIPVVFQAVILTIVIFVPWFQNLVGDLLPPDTPAFGKAATAFAYYTFWATLLGGSLGGTMSGSCKKEEEKVQPLVALQFGEGNQTVETFDTEKHVRFDLPPE